MKKQNLFLIVLLFLGNMIIYAQCSVNAGGNATICGTSYTLQGTSSGSTSGTPVWTIVSKPSGAPDPVFSNVNSLTPNVTGMTSPGNYVFQVAQNCSPSGTVTSQVTITAPGDVSTFTAGPDITNVNATTGTVTLNGVVPNGYTASWSAYNIYRWDRSSIKTSQNSQFSSTTSATTTFSLVKKADHDIDPAYVVTLRITSTNNPNCWYEDTAIVRFIPNPQILPTVSTSKCVSSGGSHYISLQSTSPKFSKGFPSSPGSSGNFGTTITMNVTSQPAGGNIAYSNIYDDNIYFTGVNVVGTYKFTLTVTNSSGTYTTPEITYTYNGTQPNPVNFLVASRPEQMMIYNSGNSGGEVHCGYAGQSTPITFYYTIDPADNPAVINTSAAMAGTPPPGGSPVVVNGGAGTATRSATITPPPGGWSIGTYRFTIIRDNAGACSVTQSYYIHISDGNRPNVTVPTTTVCYPGSGVVTATIPLPAVYKGVINSSYLQDFDGRYRLTLVSKPAGAADPVFEPYASTLFTNTSTTISNLNMQGEYVFKIKADTYNPSVGAFLDKEYACSGTSLEGTFSVFVSAQVGANAGSAQTLVGTSQTTFNANNPGVAATGAWTLLTKPAGATDPVIATSSAYNTSVTGFNTPGTYTFRWTVTTGTCTSISDLTVNVMTAAAGGVSGADFWVKSDDAGTIATAWKDQSINADNIPNVGGITLSPADRAHNFHPYTTGYSASKYFYNTNSDLNSTNNYLDPSMRSSVSVFSAVRPTSANGSGRITGIDDDTNASEPGISINSGRPHIYKYFGNGGAQANSNTMSAANAFTINKTSVFSAIQDQALNSGRGERRLGLDGIYESFNLGTTTNTFNVLGKHLKIGYATWDVNGAFPGDIMEVLWFKRALTTNEQSRVNSYLAVKNGTTLNENYLSTASNVVWDITNNTGYNNNIFGIARDNITALHQKQSGSVNDAQKLVISTTGFADSNAANGAGLTNDLQYLMAGDNGLQQSLKVPLIYTAGSNGVTNHRFESIWKVQNTNSVGTVTVAWPKSVKNLYLVQSADAVFDGTDTFSPMATEITVGGVVYNTVNVILTDGQFFTFAGFVQAPGGVVGPDFWVRSDDAGTIATAWKDNSPNADNIPNVGGITLSTADRNHNFHPYTTGYTSAKYFHNNASVMNPLGNVELPNTNTSIFSAVRPTSIAGGRIIGIDNDPANAAEPGVSITTAGRPRQYEYWQDTTSSDFSTPFNNGISNVYSAIANNNIANGGTSTITGGEKRLGLNGSYESFSGFAATNKFQIYGTNLRLGYATWDVSGPFPGDIMEVAWYNRTLTANEQSRVNSYLAVKNGVTLNENYLSTNSNVVWDRTINTGYNNNIFGIAKDEFTALSQKQSGSVNNGQKLVLSTTGFADNNVANSTSLVNDMQYLMTGDNGLKQGLAIPLSYTAGSNGAVSHRFEAIWKTQNTNGIGNITVAWPAGIENLYLIQSINETFDTGDVFTPMTGTITVNGTDYNTATVTLGDGEYFTFGGLLPNYCFTGDCNPNTFSNTSNPNTIEYDNIVGTFHSTMMRNASTGALMVWGERMANNGTTNVLTPTEVSSTNYPALTGDILKFTGGSSGALQVQSVVLTTDGLFAWGIEGTLISDGITNSTTFQKVSIGTYGVNGGALKADGLPDGVSPGDVKMLFGTSTTVALTTCSGEAWVLGQNGNVYGDGVLSSSTNHQLWHRVHIDAATTLDNVVAIRGNSSRTLMALTATGGIYTWGTSTRLGDGSGQATRTFATPMTLPAGVTPKMIGTTGNNSSTTYYILGINGNVYSMGEGSGQELGNFSVVDSNVWVQVQKSASAGDYLTNIVWISPKEHDDDGTVDGCINVLTADGRLWAWGENSNSMLGATGSTIAPTEMPGSIPATNPYDIGKLNWTDKVIAVETGGHTSMIVKENSQKYGYVGHRVNGSMGDGTSVSAVENQYNFTNTPEIDLCGAPVLQGYCYKPGILAGTVLDTKMGITALNRAGTNSDNWPMVRKGGWLALESKTKAFVPNRVAFSAGNPVGIAPANFVEGMMVYDTTNKCMKMYTSTDNGTTFGWYCISTQTCPD
ncbi:hypothetical protein [Chryseobacterium sp.]|uniref:hypothetical protein n=1 Tax=Chryseobacterium sp. TaxID=1871047 RepID=UPI0012CA736A|nr:hypothetical protein [Chryseobacterium sp.]MPS63459.1 hypothetical protein [Chryseobacterium sp.]